MASIKMFCRCCKRTSISPSPPPKLTNQEIAEIRLKRLSTNESAFEKIKEPQPHQPPVVYKRKFRELICKEPLNRRPSKPWEGSFSYNIETKETLFSTEEAKISTEN